jgi:hypothetical protein
MQPEAARRSELTKRQSEVLERLELGLGAKQIATDIGISRNAVYQTIERLRRQGALPQTYTPSGQPPRRSQPLVGGASFGQTAIATRESSLGELRRLARAGQTAEGGEYARLIEAAIASGDVAALAYELGRLDSSGEHGLAPDLIDAALRRLGALAAGEEVGGSG